MANCAWGEDDRLHPTPSSGPSECCSKTGTDSFMSLLNPPGVHHSFHIPPPALSSESSLPSGHGISSVDGYKHSSFGPLGQPVECMVDTSLCHSTGSSAVASSSHRSCLETMSPSGTSSPGGTALQEHDYMGLTEVSSSLVSKQETVTEKPVSAEPIPNMEETDLRLGIGPPERVLSVTTDAPVFHPTSKLGQDVSFCQMQNGLEYQNTWLRGSNSSSFIPTKTVSTLRKEAVLASGHEFDVDTRSEVAVKYGLKRGYSEAMSEFQSSSGGPRLGIYDKSVDFPSLVRTAAGSSVGMKNALHHSGTDSSVPSQHQKFQPPSFHCGWAALKPGVNLRQLGLEHPGASSGAYSSLQIHPHLVGSQEADMTRRACVARSDDEHEDAQEDSSPQKGQVVGWPPIRSFRKTTLAAHPKSIGEAEGVEIAVDSHAGASGYIQGSQTSLYVKVNMDGVPVGRKVDLRAYNSYEELSYALKEMFQIPNNGQGGHQIVLSRPSDASVQSKPFLFHNDFNLTYEDKDGDWMLVGDLPWSMFVNTICRLRISSEGTGNVPRAPERSQCYR